MLENVYERETKRRKEGEREEREMLIRMDREARGEDYGVCSVSPG